MTGRLKNKFNRLLLKHKKTGKEDAGIDQVVDQRDSATNARKSTGSQAAIQPTQSTEIFEPQDLWQAAYDQLDVKQQQILSSIQTPSKSKDKNASSRELIDDIVRVTKQQYETYQQKSDDTIRKSSQKIINAVLSFKDIITAVAALDPTQHAASAWTVVSLGLSMTQNYQNARNALFESSEYLADVLAQSAFIERKFYLDGHPDTRDHVRSVMISLYRSVLHYSAQIRNAQESSMGRILLDSITGPPLTELKTSLEKEREYLGRWVQLGGYLRHERDAENLLVKIDDLGESMKLLLEKSSFEHLHVVERALYDAHGHEHEDPCLQGTRTELLSRIIHWAESDDKLIFWLNGMAGTGKSTIARTVAQIFKDRGLLGATFFFKRGEADRGIATYLITSIVGQLVTKYRQLAPEVLSAIRTDPRITSKFLNIQFDQLLYQPLSKLQSDQSTTTVFVIDALDECDGDDDIKLILHLLFKLQEIKSIRLRVILTSRPELPIRYGFQEEKNHQDLVLQEVPAPVIERDIRLFLQYKLKVIQHEKKLPSDWPGNDNIDKLVQMAVPLFIFAATACRFIKDGLHPQKQLQKYLDIGITSATQMEKTYRPILDQLIRNDEEILQEFQEIVGVIILLATPLSVTSLALLLQKSSHELNDLLGFLSSVLNLPSDTNTPVSILHLSFRDFLLSTESDFRINKNDTHRKIASNCLRIMETRLSHNICDLASYGQECRDIDPQIIQQRLPADLQYSCYYWVHHLKQSQGGISEWEVLSFLKKRFLYWLEALALMGNISEAVTMIKTLESSIWKKLDPALSGFLYDARRFTLQNAYLAGIAPLQLYCSGLAFAPTQSVIKETFLSEIPNQIQPLPAVKDSWSLSLQTLEGHSDSVTSVAFSPDGLTLASGSWDNTIKLWDTATGTQRQTLEDHSHFVVSVAFSPDGLTLASGSWDNTIKLWDTATGTQRQTLEGHSDSVTSVAFSPDGLTLASGSWDNTIKLWDTATGTQRQTLEDHSHWVTSVAFSPDGLTLASGSWDNTIKLWDTATGTQRQTLEDHSHWVTSVAFSPDGLTLASGSWDNTIKLWDTATGTQRQTLEDHSHWVTSVAFSPDGLTLASGSDDNTIKLWDTATGTQRQTLEGHLGRVTSVAFSPDGLTLASGSDDNTIKLWDTATGTQRQTLEGHSNCGTSVAFSPDGLTLASGSWDNTIKLWDTATGTQRQTLEGHSDSVTSVAFSPDGLTLASGSDDNTIKLWDTATGTQRQTLEGHSSGINSSVFSTYPGELLEKAPETFQISLSSNWVSFRGENILWLPDEYRSFSCQAVKNATLALGFRDGRVLITGFHTHIL
ncbi:hypothetical protein N7495_001665 [Penicillium taxi]|uniref:uncharacterized protein n=1 Tax=Penicillium taxi TaxID=168475 RepID=UPI0025451C1A|nr:uncharacterized protein N7495_001665 [Penicillium taxi]KAJ5908983.1 hypothetical protein N7495_001665 [Penicillium taxi]